MADAAVISGGRADRESTRPGARRQAPGFLVLLVIVGAQFMLVLDTNIMNVALPTVGRYMHQSQTSMTWTINCYTLAFGGFLLLGGRVGDLIGRRQALTIGLVLFSVGGLLGGTAVVFPILLIGRVIQGLGGALAAPAALSLCSAPPSPRQRSGAGRSSSTPPSRERAPRPA